MVTGSNGLPVATSALPLVQVSTSPGVASARDIGFDSAMTTRLAVTRGHRQDDAAVRRSRPGTWR